MHASGVRPLPLATAAPLGCVVLLFVCQHCAPLALFVALAGYQSLSPTNNAVLRKGKVKNRKSPYLEVIGSLQ